MVENNRYMECHINHGNTPDIRYDVHGNVVGTVTNSGDKQSAIANCTTAACMYVTGKGIDSGGEYYMTLSRSGGTDKRYLNSNSWLKYEDIKVNAWQTDPNTSIESMYLMNAVRCLWVKTNGNTLEGCENYELPD